MKFTDYHKNIFAAVLLIFSITACNDVEKSNSNKRTIADVIGRQISIPDTVNKIVGVRAASLRFISYLNAVDMVVGVEENEHRGNRVYTIAHPELKELPQIGPMMGGDAELILKQQPDVIFMTYTTAEFADKLQQKTGIPVVVIEAPPFVLSKDKMYKSINLMAEVLNKQKRADSLINFIEKQLDLLAKLSSNQEFNKSVYVGGISYRGAHGINSTQAFYPPFEFIKVNNIAKSIDSELISHTKGTFIDIEQILKWNPDYIFIDKAGLDLCMKDFKENPILRNNLKAFADSNVYSVLPYNNYATNYELNIINAFFIGKKLKPQAFKNIDLNQKAKEIIKAFYGKDAYDKIYNEYPAFKSLR